MVTPSTFVISAPALVRPVLLLLTVVLHIYFTIRLAIENRRARPAGYKKSDHVKATFASRHMVVSGLVVLAFIIYHLAAFHRSRVRSAFSAC